MKIVYDALTIEVVWGKRAKYPLWITTPIADALSMTELIRDVKITRFSFFTSICNRYYLLGKVCYMPRRLRKIIDVIRSYSYLIRTEEIEDKVLALWSKWTLEWLHWYRRWKQRFDNSK